MRRRKRWCPECVVFHEHESENMKGRCRCGCFPIAERVVRAIETEMYAETRRVVMARIGVALGFQ